MKVIKRFKRGKSRDHVRINDEITAKEVRVISSSGEQIGILPTDEALRMAEEEGLDLVEVAAKSNPPVCKIIDYGKHAFQQKKKQQEAKKKQKIIHVKEIKFKLSTEKHDIDFKEKHLERFLKEGNKAKVRLVLYGREMTLVDRGIEMLNRIAEDLKEYAEIDQPPKLEGRHIIMILAPAGKGKKKQ
ncbi:MAG: translation initiation factor IF-3 [Candidatus Schekmanbacteria bacterium]|nr:MAG: translation initiation factor IF-3 [Candidatus Schekmanbacteria bacterium]